MKIKHFFVHSKVLLLFIISILLCVSSFCLTKRETEVLSLIEKGLTNDQIACQLNLKRRTVEFHVSNILRKLEVSSRLEAAVLITKNRYTIK